MQRETKTRKTSDISSDTRPSEKTMEKNLSRTKSKKENLNLEFYIQQKTSFQNKGGIKTFSDKQKLKKFSTSTLA